MKGARRITVPLAGLAAVAALWAGPAAASPEQVVADQADNGIVDGSYSPTDLDAAIRLAQRRGGPQADRAVNAIRDAQGRTLFGGGPQDTPTTAPGKDDPGTSADPSEPSAGSELEVQDPVLNLPRAPVANPGETVPVPFIVLSVLAGLLMVGGAASSAFRRMSRP